MITYAYIWHASSVEGHVYFLFFDGSIFHSGIMFYHMLRLTYGHTNNFKK